MKQKRHNVLISSMTAAVGSALFYLFFKKARKRHKSAALKRAAGTDAAEPSENGTEAEKQPEEEKKEV
jgi:hypothetical protein